MSIFNKKHIEVENVIGLADKFNELRKMINKVEGYCTLEKAHYSFLGGHIEVIGVNTKVEEIEKKLDRLIDYLDLEEHKPSCKIMLKKKDKKGGMT